MIIKHELITRYDAYQFKIPYGVRDKVLVKVGNNVKVGDELVERKENLTAYSIFIPNELDMTVKEIPQYITCIHGEFVNEGDTLVEKPNQGGLTVAKLVSPVEGVVDLERIEAGYLDILGEEGESVSKSTFTGKVLDINPVDGIVFESSASAMDIKILSKMYQKEEPEKIIGEFVVVGDGSSLQLKADDTDYTNKIVFAGKYLHTSLLQDLFERGAAFVLAYSMEYADFRRQTLPLGLLGGFGEVSCSNSILSLLSARDGDLCSIDLNESQIFFLSDKKEKVKTKESAFVQNAVGSIVRSLSPANYSMLGKVTGMEEDRAHIAVAWENGSQGLIEIGSVEFVCF